ESLLPIALGIRADGGWHQLGGWTTLGLVISVLVLWIKSETVLVHVARAEAGLSPARDTEAVAAPRASGIAVLRRAAGRLPFYRDDDASIVGDDALARVAQRFADDPSLGAVQLGVVPRDGGAYSRDWVPRLRVGDRTRPSDVAVLWEGAVAVRRSTFELV